MKYRGYVALLLCVLTLAACRTMQAVQDDIGDLPAANFSINQDPAAKLIGSCPVVEIVQDLAVFSDFAPPSDMSANNLVSSVGMTRMATSCNQNRRSVTVDLQLAFEAELGPNGRMSSSDKPYFTYPYFVAVTDPSGKIMAKEIFAASMAFDAGETRHVHQETLRDIIPLDNPSNIGNYHVLIGFQLSQDQLAFNRAAIARAKKEAKAMAAQTAPVQAAPAQIAPAEAAPIDLTPK